MWDKAEEDSLLITVGNIEAARREGVTATDSTVVVLCDAIIQGSRLDDAHDASILLSHGGSAQPPIALGDN